MTEHHTVTVTITTGHDDPASPAAKAAHVADLVRVYGDLLDPGESLDLVVMDLVADLLHFADTIPEDQRDYGVTGPLAPWVIERATNHYHFELGND